MNTVNVNVSVNNLPQFDRHQNDIHKNPTVFQDQNAKIAQGEIEHKLQMPVETEAADGKKVDSKQKKEEQSAKKKQHKGSQKENNSEKKGGRSRDEGGFFVDIEA